MNIPLAREIYGHTPWMVDSFTFRALLNTLTDFKNGNIILQDDKANNFGLFDLSNATRIISSTGQIDTTSSDDYISIINLNGVITKEGGASSYGTKDLVRQLMRFDENPNIIGHIILVDSGGGSASGMKVMRRGIKQLTKPIAGLIEYGGVAASAALGILIATGRTFAESETDMIGSIGTMLSFAGRPDKSIGLNGDKQVTIYATASTAKNKWVEEALNNDNYELARTEFLDPFNEEFIAGVKEDRPNVLETQLDGSVYKTGEVVGTLIDEIGTFTDVVNWIKSQSKINIFKNKNNTAMTAQELLAQFPAVHAEIFGAGVTSGEKAERDRVGSWMAHSGTDIEAVSAGIKSGEPISATAREEFLVKASSKQNLSNLQSDSPSKVITKEAESKEIDQNASADQAEAEAIYGKGVKLKIA